MVFWAGNFIVVKGALGVLPPLAVHDLRYVLASRHVLALLRWREGSIRLPRARHRPAGAARRPRVRRLPDALDGRRSSRSRPAIPRCSSPRRRSCRADRGRRSVPDTLDAGRSSSGRSFPSRVWALVVAAGNGSEPRRLARRRSPHPGGGRRAGRSTRPSARRLCAAIPRSVYRLGGRSPARCSCSSGRDLASSRRRDRRPIDAGRSRGALLGPLAAGSPNVLVFARRAPARTDPRRPRSSSLVPALAVVFAAIFLGEPIRRRRSSAAVIIVGRGVAAQAAVAGPPWRDPPVANGVTRCAGPAPPPSRRSGRASRRSQSSSTTTGRSR